jgi:hypothetical protein
MGSGLAITHLLFMAFYAPQGDVFSPRFEIEDFAAKIAAAVLPVAIC